MHCNLRPPEPRQPFSALITMPYQVWRRWTYPLPYYSVFCCWYIALRRGLDLWPLTLDICSVSFVTWWNCVPNLNAIEQSAAEILRFKLDLSVWPYDLEHVLSVALGSGIIFAKFDFRQLIRAWIITIFDAGTLRQLWPWPLTFWHRKFVIHQVSRDQSLYEIWAKSSNLWLNYW